VFRCQFKIIQNTLTLYIGRDVKGNKSAKNRLGFLVKPGDIWCKIGVFQAVLMIDISDFDQ
jgi:hypothetical protein